MKHFGTAYGPEGEMIKRGKRVYPIDMSTSFKEAVKLTVKLNTTEPRYLKLIYGKNRDVSARYSDHLILVHDLRDIAEQSLRDDTIPNIYPF